MSDFYSVDVKIEVPRARIYDLLITGIESGGYGSAIIEEGDWEAGWKAAEKGAHNAFGLIGLIDKYEYEEGNKTPVIRMTDAALIRGLRDLAKGEPHHFHAFMEETDDALTGDAFVQCVMFREVIYG